MSSVLFFLSPLYSFDWTQLGWQLTSSRDSSASIFHIGIYHYHWWQSCPDLWVLNLNTASYVCVAYVFTPKNYPPLPSPLYCKKKNTKNCQTMVLNFFPWTYRSVGFGFFCIFLYFVKIYLCVCLWVSVCLSGVYMCLNMRADIRKGLSVFCLFLWDRGSSQIWSLCFLSKPGS